MAHRDQRGSMGGQGSLQAADSAEAQQEEQKKREEARKNYPQPATWLKIAKLC